MKNSTAILATIALGAALAVGSATASMARGDSGGHGGGGHGGSSGASLMDRVNGADGGTVGVNHGFGHESHFGGLRRHDEATAFWGSSPFCSYGPASGTYTGLYGRHYCS
jgi:hypothetical protein